jgi:predicted RNase H-like HicB family nuclease
MSKRIDYSSRIIWSEADQAYLAAAAELPGCLADGQTPEEAIQNLRVIVSEWIETAKEEGRDIPSPMTVEGYEAMSREANEKAQANLNALISNVVAAFVQRELPGLVKEAIRREGVTRIEVDPPFAEGGRRSTLKAG